MTREEAIQIIRKHIPHLGIGSTEMTEALTELIPELRESEKPMNQGGLEEELVKYIGYPEEDLDGKWKKKEVEDIARHFAQWGAEHLADARFSEPKDGDGATDAPERYSIEVEL